MLLGITKCVFNSAKGSTAESLCFSIHSIRIRLTDPEGGDSFCFPSSVSLCNTITTISKKHLWREYNVIGSSVANRATAPIHLPEQIMVHLGGSLYIILIAKGQMLYKTIYDGE